MWKNRQPSSSPVIVNRKVGACRSCCGRQLNGVWDDAGLPTPTRGSAIGFLFQGRMIKAFSFALIATLLSGCATRAAPAKSESTRAVLRSLMYLDVLAASYCRTLDAEPFCYIAENHPAQYTAIHSAIDDLLAGLKTEQEFVAFALSCRAIGRSDSHESFAYDVFFDEAFWKSLNVLDRMATPSSKRGLSIIRQSCLGDAQLGVWFLERRGRDKREAAIP